MRLLLFVVVGLLRVGSGTAGDAEPVQCPLQAPSQVAAAALLTCSDRATVERSASCCREAWRTLQERRADYASLSGRILLRDEEGSVCISKLASDLQLPTDFLRQQCNISEVDLTARGSACSSYSTIRDLRNATIIPNFLLPAECAYPDNATSCRVCLQAVAASANLLSAGVPDKEGGCLESIKVAVRSLVKDARPDNNADVVIGQCFWDPTVLGNLQTTPPAPPDCPLDFASRDYGALTVACDPEGKKTEFCCGLLTSTITFTMAQYAYKTGSTQLSSRAIAESCMEKYRAILESYNVSRSWQTACASGIHGRMEATVFTRPGDLGCGNWSTVAQFGFNGSYDLLDHYCGDPPCASCAQGVFIVADQLARAATGQQKYSMRTRSSCIEQVYIAWGGARLVPNLTRMAQAQNCFGKRPDDLKVKPNYTELERRAAQAAEMGPPGAGTLPAEEDLAGHSSAFVIGLAVGGGVVLVAAVAMICALVVRSRREAGRARHMPFFLLGRKTSSQGAKGGGQTGPVWFSYAALKQATNNFAQANLIGRGGSSAVYRGTLGSGEKVAVKQVEGGITKKSAEAEFNNEAAIISKIRHRNLVALRGCCSSAQHRLLVYDLMANGSLDEHLFPSSDVTGEKRHLDWPTRAKIAVDAARGLQYLHTDCQPRILHRDMKPSNILLDENFNARVADFGLAKDTDEEKSHITTRVAGTWGYLAPEYAARGQVNEKSDVYSFGVVLLELVSGRRPVVASAPQDEVFLVEWAWSLAENERFLAMVDQRLLPLAAEAESHVVRVIKVGLLCVYTVAAERPSMGSVLSMLVGHLEVPQLPPRPLTIFTVMAGQPHVQGSHQAQSRDWPSFTSSFSAVESSSGRASSDVGVASSRTHSEMSTAGGTSSDSDRRLHDVF